ncbi:hypothetical protein CEXT_41731 [Caerostris extrusa]|uniref:Uncharacterized protein n=1 Tax=Caerostris extrusa TaxID=172846 RepID=A0AAV4NTY9_CAEEX|nr:hypothetical protein CEXT_41731 [Caerostris extrusa]
MDTLASPVSSLNDYSSQKITAPNKDLPAQNSFDQLKDNEMSTDDLHDDSPSSPLQVRMPSIMVCIEGSTCGTIQVSIQIQNSRLANYLT